jgi:hypothetical protein
MKSNILPIQKNEPKKELKNFRKTQLKFDVQKLQKAMNDILNKMEWKEWHVKGFCLNKIPNDNTSIQGGNLRGIYWTKPDHTGAEVVRESPVKEKLYTELNEQFKGTYFEEVYNELKKHYKVGRVRILLKEPRTTLSWHRDPEPRLHLAILTNPGSILVIDDEAKHIPSDGHIWYANTRKYHNAFNGGEEDRIHLVATYLGEK